MYVSSSHIYLYRYKCPKCRIAYCSVQCCRAHKEKGCQPNETPVTSKYLPPNLLLRDIPQNPIPRRKNQDDDLEEGWKITDNMKIAMDSSDWLKKELHDGGLRQIIHEICLVSNTVANGGKTHQELALEEAKRNYPSFGTFVDKLLVLTGVLERQHTDTDLSQWLEEDDLGPLALVSIPRQIRAPLNTTDESCSASDSEESDSDESESSEETSCSDSDDE
jgi:zinc finger HIT domain-containing protein 3